RNWWQWGAATPSSTSFSFEDKYLSKQGKVGRGILTKEKLLANTEAAPIEPDALAFDPSLPGMALLHQPMRLLEALSYVLAGWLGPHATLLDSRVAIRRIIAGQPETDTTTIVAS